MKIFLPKTKRNEYKDMMFYTFEFNGKKYKMTNSYLKEFKKVM